MNRLLTALGVLLILWGAFVLVTGEFVATLDIAASLVSSGVVVIALGAIVRALDRLAPAATAGGEAAVSIPSPAFPKLKARATPVRDPAPVPPAAKSDPAEPVFAEPELPAASFEDERPSAPAEPDVPTLVREGVIEGRRYRFFSDGSIEAEGPRGIRRYASIDEAREQILRDREEPVAPPPAPSRSAPAPQLSEKGGSPMPMPSDAVRRTQQDGSSAPVRPPRAAAPSSETASASAPSSGPAARPAIPPRPPAAKPSGSNVTWESYLARGASKETGAKDATSSSASSGGASSQSAAPRPKPGPAATPSEPLPEPSSKPADEEWSEPFRKLLKGEGPDRDKTPDRR